MREREKAKAEQATRLAQQRQSLIQHGTAYAERELRAVDGLSLSDTPYVPPIRRELYT